MREEQPVKSNLTMEDWGKATGFICSDCGREAMRVIDGLCPQCHREKMIKRDQEIEEKKARRYYKDRLRQGDINLSEMREGR